MEEGQSAHNFWGHQDFGSNQEGSAELAAIFNGKNVFDNPKPIKLLKALIKISTSENDIVLDFFGGSGSAAHAVFELNKEDGHNRKFILIQLPEKISETEEAFKLGFKTIAEVTKARLTKIVNSYNNKIKSGLNFDKCRPLGFRYFQLASSNFKIWRGDFLETEEDIIKQLHIFNTLEKENVRTDNIAWEIAIKNGIPLTSQYQSLQINEDTFYFFPEKKLIIAPGSINLTSAKELIKKQKVK